MKAIHFKFKELLVWQKAIDFADYAIELVENWDVSRSHFRLVEQFESAASSVSMNIAEGKGRSSKKEFVQFLYIARGSLYEVVTLAVIFEKRNWITPNQLCELEDQAFEVASMIKGLINSLYKS